MIRAPSSIWSLPEPAGPFIEESLLPRLGAPPPRFPFSRTAATAANASPSQTKMTSHRVNNRSCERVGQAKVASEGSRNGDISGIGFQLVQKKKKKKKKKKRSLEKKFYCRDVSDSVGNP
ncbi:unnamed protein product [Dibothriocephalus latus]|uniref:Uncharacterized protein n=1 Tax=Dibothriocephalus latus TaxID=60516 RepID=A0A3P7NYF4_DIBLA|nr:unnamed protein product [Dibothriocephalus latus]